MERDRLQEFHEAVADAQQHIHDASQLYLSCRKDYYGKPLTVDQNELLVGAWISALASMRETVVQNALALGYSVEQITTQDVVRETEQLEKWLRGTKEKKNVNRRHDDDTSSSV